MSINASSTYQTSIEQKIRARNCALMIKHGSPKLRDLLRQNCRIKMKESRENAFSSARSTTIEKRVNNLTNFDFPSKNLKIIIFIILAIN